MVDEDMPETWAVYKITHIETGRVYYGCSSQPNERLQQHRRARTAPRLHEALQQYGLAAFSLEVVEVCRSRKHAHAIEKRMIRENGSIWPNGFNLAKGGRGTLAPNLAPNVRERLSAACTERLASPEARERHRAGCLNAWQGEAGAARKHALSDRWKDPEFKERSLAGVRRLERWNGPGADAEKKKAAHLKSEWNRRRWQVPEYAAHMKKMMSERAISAETRRKIGDASRRMWAENPPRTDSPVRRARLSAALTEYYAANPKPIESNETRAKKAAAARAYWERRRAAVAAGEMERVGHKPHPMSPQARANVSASITAWWNGRKERTLTPERRAKVSAGLKAAYESGRRKSRRGIHLTSEQKASVKEPGEGNA